MEDNIKQHKVIIEGRKRVIISGVDDVDSFDEEKVMVRTAMGDMTINGGDFRISKLNVEDGQLIIDGDIDEISYSDSHFNDDGRGFFGKLFR